MKTRFIRVYIVVSLLLAVRQTRAQAQVEIPHSPDRPLLMERPKAPVAAIKEYKYAEIRTWTYDMSNGVRLVVRPDENAKDIRIRGFSRAGVEAIMAGEGKGGTGLAGAGQAGFKAISAGPVAGDMHPVSPLLSAYYSGGIIGSSGLGEYDAAGLRSLLEHRDVKVVPGIDRHFATITAACSDSELETALQMIYLYFKAPHKEQAAFETYIRDLRTRNEQYHKDVYAIYRRRMDGFLDRADSGQAFGSAKGIDSIGLDAACDAFHRSFGNARGFTFVITGALKGSGMNVSRYLAMIQQYLGALPSGPVTYDTTVRAIVISPGHHSHILHAGVNTLGAGGVVYRGNYLYGDSLNLQLTALSTIWLRRWRILAQRAGFSVSDDTVGLKTAKQPRSVYSLELNFRCRPEDVDTLIAIGRMAADAVRGGVSEDETRLFMEEGKKALKAMTFDNAFWTDYLEDKFRRGDDPYEIAHYPYYYRKVTPQSLMATAAWALSGDNFTKFGLMTTARKL
jgi:zinc protease